WLTSALDFMPKWSRIAAFVMGAVAVLMLILTGTRGAWLAFLVELAFIACFYKRWRVLAAKGMLVLLALMAVLFSTVPVLQTRIETMANPNFQSNSERLLMWKSASEIVADYPIHGIGQDVFGFEYNTKYIAPEAKERSEPGKPETGHTHPHNNLLKVTSEGGILGFCSFLLLHGYFFWRFWKMQRQEHSYMMISYGMTAVLVALGLQLEGITDTNMNQVPIMREYWLLVGMLLIAGRVTGYKQHHGN
ncbi:MAG: O-antigen ligase family protein, partial [Selenomonadaceae bacterium]|nr:O-antigen ligase family protein [Selenomonadaceae bacterium]